MLKSFWLIIAVSISLSIASFDWLFGVSGDYTQKQFSEKVNLALRRTAHFMLKSAGDSTSQIQPVKSFEPNVFVIQMESSLNYDLLPKLLSESFEIHEINQKYDVSVLNCKDGELELGYNSYDFLKNNEVPCGGRRQAKGCYNLKISFANPVEKTNPKPIWLVSTLGVLLIGFVVWKRRKPTDKKAEVIEKTTNTDKLTFADSSFSFINQVLETPEKQHDLTYREAKLLNLFLINQNQLLERDYILKSVWEDEGIVVGRSLDVFVSRLRKMLQSDAKVQITTIHGVGYKLVIEE